MNLSPKIASPVVAATSISKVFGSGDTAVTALNEVSIEFARGSFSAIMGPSGSGKSTLMHLLAGLDTPTSGQIRISETDITRLNDTQLTQLRRKKVGFVFQAFNLVPTLTAEQNITLPALLANEQVDRAWFDVVVSTLGLTERLDHKPHELSGGQQQRVAVARALHGHPDVIFADEPTGNLDSRAGAEVLSLLRSSSREMQQTIIMVTHDPNAASYAERVVMLADGKLSGELHGADAPQISTALAQLGA